MHHADRCRAVISLTVPHFARGIGLRRFCRWWIERSIQSSNSPAGNGTTCSSTRSILRVRFGSSRRMPGSWKIAVQSHLRRRRRPARPSRIHSRARRLAARSRGPDTAGASDAAVRSGRADHGGGDRTKWHERCLFVVPQRRRESCLHNRGTEPWPPDDAGAVPARRLDVVCDSALGALAEPMREDVVDLTEVRIAGGHMLMSEKPGTVNAGIATWLDARFSIAT